jgi:hypothetical protein
MMESLFKLGLVLVLLFRELQSGPVIRELAFLCVLASPVVVPDRLPFRSLEPRAW